MDWVIAAVVTVNANTPRCCWLAGLPLTEGDRNTLTRTSKCFQDLVTCIDVILC